MPELLQRGHPDHLGSGDPQGLGARRHSRAVASRPGKVSLFPAAPREAVAQALARVVWGICLRGFRVQPEAGGPLPAPEAGNTERAGEL